MTKMQLCNRLFSSVHGDNWQTWQASDGTIYEGYLDSIQREDGSGSSFNVTINLSVADGYKTVTFHLRTID
jgi:hypothetical protein